MDFIFVNLCMSNIPNYIINQFISEVNESVNNDGFFPIKSEHKDLLLKICRSAKFPVLKWIYIDNYLPEVNRKLIIVDDDFNFYDAIYNGEYFISEEYYYKNIIYWIYVEDILLPN